MRKTPEFSSEGGVVVHVADNPPARVAVERVSQSARESYKSLRRSRKPSVAPLSVSRFVGSCGATCSIDYEERRSHRAG